MTSSEPGKSISKIEVLNISTHGIWLFVKGREYFLDHKQFPWFQKATVAEIMEVELLHGFHLHWPKLDVDLELDSLETPERYPLVYE